MSQSDIKKTLSHIYWTNIREISKNISNLTSATSGKQIDYFEIIKTRLDKYVAVLQKSPNNKSGASSIIGSVFAEVCNLRNDAITILTHEAADITISYTGAATLA